MKKGGSILRVMAHMKRREFLLETRSGKYTFPFSQLRLCPSPRDPLEEVYVDKEAGNEAFTYRLQSGKEDTILLDNVLWFHRDPELLRKFLLHDLTNKANERIKEKKIGKRYLMRKLQTSPSQLYRLLDQSYYKKTLDQMLKLLVALGIDVKVKTTKVA